MGKDTLSIRFCGEQLCIGQNNQPANGYRAIFSSPTTFSAKEVPDAIVSVLMDTEGKAEGLEINQGGMKVKAKKTL